MEISIGSINVTENRRAVDYTKVREIAESMSQVGLINAISVRRVGDEIVLVAGKHRLEAAKSLGWDKVEATVLELDELGSELAEIDENLMRNELHYMDRGNSIKRRDELLIEMGLRAKVGDNQHAGGGAPGALPKTTKQIAESIGISERTLQEDKQIATAIIPEVQEVIKSADVTKKDAIKIARLEPEEQLKVAEKINSGSRDFKDAIKQVRSEEREQRKDYSRVLETQCDLIVGDITTGLPEISDNSVDFIITDPPYPKEYIHLYGHLSNLASRVLKDGGSALVMCGQSYLPDVIAELCKDLTYHWTLCYLTPGGQSPSLWQKRTNTFWKPVIWLTKGTYTGDYIGDKITSPANDKDFHEWGQSVGGFSEIVEKFTDPGHVILDPFLGGGTTGLVCAEMKRNFIGVDINPAHVETSRKRIFGG